MYPSIIIKVRFEDNSEVYFRLRSCNKLGKLFTRFCEHKALVMDNVRVSYHFEAIYPDSTAESLGLVDGGEIFATTEQAGD
jgi:hypothetical protein